MVSFSRCGSTLLLHLVPVEVGKWLAKTALALVVQSGCGLRQKLRLTVNRRAILRQHRRVAFVKSDVTHPLQPYIGDPDPIATVVFVSEEVAHHRAVVQLSQLF